MKPSSSRTTLPSLCLAAVVVTASALGVDARAQEHQEPALGIDVSHHSGEIDWDQVVGEGLGFVYVKATEGVDDADPKFEEHWRRLGELGIKRGVYHFYVTEDDPLEQAEFFLSRFDLAAGDLVPVVDIELIGKGTTGELPAELQRFLDLVERRTGVTPMIYTSAKFWNAHLDASFSRYPLWVAEYEVGEPTIPAGWKEWTVWQFEGDVTVPGIEKGADRSRVRRGADLEALTVRPATSPNGE